MHTIKNSIMQNIIFRLAILLYLFFVVLKLLSITYFVLFVCHKEANDVIHVVSRAAKAASRFIQCVGCLKLMTL